MTLTEATQYESQGWPHQHVWDVSRTIAYNPLIPHIEVFKCRCGEIKIKRGDFEWTGNQEKKVAIALASAGIDAIVAMQNTIKRGL